MLKDSQDAYGHQLYDCFKGREVVEVVERDDGYIDPSRSLPRAYLSDYKDWPSYERKAMRYAKGRVLDIGSGGGRCSLYLQEKGLEVVGIDNSPLAVKVCKLRGLKNVLEASISDVGPQLGRFDTILMIGNNFGLFGGFEQARRLLRRFHRLTNARALIVAESNDPYKTSEPFHLAYHQLSLRRGRMPGQLKIRVRYKRYVTPLVRLSHGLQGRNEDDTSGHGVEGKAFHRLHRVSLHRHHRESGQVNTDLISRDRR